MQSVVREDTASTGLGHDEHMPARWRYLPYTLAIGLLFLLPHLVRMCALGSIREYTPFSVTTPSNVVWDESYMYASQANVMLQQHRWADDTDRWEHRAVRFPYSALPAGLEAGLAMVLAPGHPRVGLEWAQMLLHFAFPMFTAWMLMLLLERAGVSGALPATLALLVLVVAFSAGTLRDSIISLLRSGFSGPFYATLQASRSPNPNISFAIFLAAMLLLLRGLRSQSVTWLALAGILGSALFYCYAYYAIAWCAACGLLLLTSFWRRSGISTGIVWTIAFSVLGAMPYIAWTHVSKKSGMYAQRMNRFGMVLSHALTPAGRYLTMVWGLATLVLLAAWLWTRRGAVPSSRREEVHRTVLPVAAAALGGIAGMDMQVITGFNVQAEFHFMHMVVQPAVAFLGCILIAWWLQRTARHWFWKIAFVAVLAVCAASQVNAGIHSAPYHRLIGSDQALFNWLEKNSATGSVVSTTNLRLGVEIPIYTHNNLLLVNGSRASGSDEELLERLLLAHRLVGVSEARLAEELHGDQWGGDGVQIESYSEFLFEDSPWIYIGTHNIADQMFPAVLERYRQMDVSAELHRFRVDYIYARHGESPISIAGWHTRRVLETPEGTLWRLEGDDAK